MSQKSQHFYILFRQMKFLVVYWHFISKKVSLSWKLLYLFLFCTIVIPIWVLPATHVFFIFFAQRQSYCFFHGFVCPSSTDIRFETLTFDAFFMIFLYSFLLNPKLVLIVKFKAVLRWLRIVSFNWKYLVALALDSD